MSAAFQARMWLRSDYGPEAGKSSVGTFHLHAFSSFNHFYKIFVEYLGGKVVLQGNLSC